MAHQQPPESGKPEEKAGRETWFPPLPPSRKDAGEVDPAARRSEGRVRPGEGGVGWGWGVTNLECENLITVESGVCAVARRPLRRGSDRLKR